MSVRVVLPAHLRTLAQVTGELSLDVDTGSAPLTIGAVLDAVETAHPVLRGAIRDRASGKRRPFVRFFVCEEDLSHEPADTPLPAIVADGKEPFIVLGAMAGG